MEELRIQEKHKHIWTVKDREEKKFLETPVPDFAYERYPKKDIDTFIKHMRGLMVRARGIGLSANQVGAFYRLFVAQLPATDGSGYTGKFYTLINPRIVSYSTKKIIDEEGCLSIPHTYGMVARAERMVITGLDKQGRPLRVKAEGLLARIFQHEMDHLDGILFTSKAKHIYTLQSDAGRIAKG